MRLGPARLSRVPRIATAGFTLVELMVASALAAALMVSIGWASGNLGRANARSLAAQTVKDDLTVALQMLAYDVEHLGTGVAVDLVAYDDVNVYNLRDEVLDITGLTLSDVNISGTNPPVSDELLIGGAGLDLSQTGAKSTSVGLNFSAAQDWVHTVRLDGPGVGYHGPATSYLDPQVGEYVSVVDPVEGWRSPNPEEVVATTEYTGYIALQLAAPLPNSAEVDDLIFVHRAVSPDGGGVPVAPWHIQRARWFVDVPNRQLLRELEIDPKNNPGVFWTIPVLNNVLDLQVAYLVWSCDNAQATWVDSIVAEFQIGSAAGSNNGGTCYRPVGGAIGTADRFLAMRGRLMAIRVTLLLREAQALARVGNVLDNLQFDPGVAGRISIEDVIHDGLNQQFRYYVVQQVLDPVNLRLKTGSDPQQFRTPAVRSLLSAQSTLVVDAGYFSGKVSN